MFNTMEAVLHGAAAFQGVAVSRFPLKLGERLTGCLGEHAVKLPVEASDQILQGCIK